MEESKSCLKGCSDYHYRNLGYLLPSLKGIAIAIANLSHLPFITLWPGRVI